MSTIHKCDKCGKTIEENKSISVKITDLGKIFGKLRLFDNFELCEKCGKKHLSGLTRIFSTLKNDKN